MKFFFIGFYDIILFVVELFIMLYVFNRNGVVFFLLLLLFLEVDEVSFIIVYGCKKINLNKSLIDVLRV